MVCVETPEKSYVTGSEFDLWYKHFSVLLTNQPLTFTYRKSYWQLMLKVAFGQCSIASSSLMSFSSFCSPIILSVVLSGESYHHEWGQSQLDWWFKSMH